MHNDDDLAVEYDHVRNQEFHSVEGAAEVLQAIFPSTFPGSVLDVGCGTGTWLRAALNCGATDVLGIDGIDPAGLKLFVDPNLIVRADLNRPLNLGRKFELVVCVETAEHLEPPTAATVIDSLVNHGDTILFSAAVPRQPGTHHVNCQWPDYWQHLFNERGYACDDHVRWSVWDNPLVEPWYRQNLMMAKRDEARAGNEPRIHPVLHPDMMTYFGWSFFDENISRIEDGALPAGWYASAPLKAFMSKLRRLRSRQPGPWRRS